MIAPKTGVAVGVYGLELWVSLEKYPEVTFLKIESFMTLTVLDCQNAILSTLSQFATINLPYNAAPKVQ
jgi:hypothetical protein